MFPVRESNPGLAVVSDIFSFVGHMLRFVVSFVGHIYLRTHLALPDIPSRNRAVCGPMTELALREQYGLWWPIIVHSYYHLNVLI